MMRDGLVGRPGRRVVMNLIGEAFCIVCGSALNG